jgi:hypothetical protein
LEENDGMNLSEQMLHINGVSASTGKPLVDSISYESLANHLIQIVDPKELEKENEPYVQLKARLRFGQFEYDNPQNVGWTLLTHKDEKEDMEDYLSVLLDHRDAKETLTYNGENLSNWMLINKALVTNPQLCPYYILIAGSPEKIPFNLQFLLDIPQAVGRIHFDNPNDYRQYAANIVEQEKYGRNLPEKKAVFFAPDHDPATNEIHTKLVKPLVEGLPGAMKEKIPFDDYLAVEATKDSIVKALQTRPALLFTARNGVGVPKTSKDQKSLQGAIRCQDGDFPLSKNRRVGFLTGYDVPEGFSLPQGIMFAYACYGAGTRKKSDFNPYIPDDKKSEEFLLCEGKEDFIGFLPKALLSDPAGGALAVVSHVDPAWGVSFKDPVTEVSRPRIFGYAVRELLEGKPVGYAMTNFNMRYSNYNSLIVNMLEPEVRKKTKLDPFRLSGLWVCRNDAQNYCIIGDPAVSLRFK